MDFVPDERDDGLNIPYFEDASSVLGVIGHSTQRSEKELRIAIELAMGHLGASVSLFQAGKFGDRYGYRIEFIWRGARGRIDVAALPLKKETKGRIKRCKQQALFSVMHKLQGQFNSQLNMPGDVPLVPYMLDTQGRTLIEAMRERDELPALTDSGSDSEIIEGDFRESD
jgi:hypothetical protein